MEDVEKAKGKKGNVLVRWRDSGKWWATMLWCVTTFPLMLAVTLLVAPVAYIYEVAVEMPRVFRNFFSDLFGVFADEWRTGARAVANGWRSWWFSIVGRRNVRVNVNVTVVDTGEGECVFPVDDGED